MTTEQTLAHRWHPRGCHRCVMGAACGGLRHHAIL